MANPFKAAQERSKVVPGSGKKQEREGTEAEQLNGDNQQPMIEEKEVVAAGKVETKEEPPKVEPVVEQVPAPVKDADEEVDVAEILAKRYADYRSDTEPKTARFNALLKPSLLKKMDKDVRAKRIRSKNDLINFLLEQHYNAMEKK